MPARGRYRAVLVVALALLTGCPAPGPVERAPARPEADIVWPPPPLAPRIRFLRVIAEPEDVGVREGWFESVLTFLKGAPERQFSSPYGIHKDAHGRLYVVDTVQKAVQVFDAQAAETYWFPDDRLEGFENPIGVAADDAGRVYVSDSLGKVVHVFDDYGRRYVSAIGRGLFERPTGLALNGATGELLVADTLAGQIVVFDSRSLAVTRYVGRRGTEENAFHFPTSVAVADDGMIFVTDALNFRVQVLHPDFTFARSFGRPGDSPGHFSRPKGVAVDSDGHVYVVDALFDNVQVFDRDGGLLLAFGQPGSGPGEFWLPNEIFIDEQNRIYVSDAYNQRLQVFQYLKQESVP